MYFVYILKSKKNGSRYIGVTQDLIRRIQDHNAGGNKYTTTKKPFKLLWYCVFSEKEKAYLFERYLKSSSGYAFSKKRLI